MRCKACDKEIEDGMAVCPFCGKEQDIALRDDASVPVHVGPLGTSKPSLTWGILSAAFACTCFLSPLAIIFGFIGLNRARHFRQYTGRLYGRALAGRWLSIVGIIAGAVLSTALVIMAITGTVISIRVSL